MSIMIKRICQWINNYIFIDVCICVGENEMYVPVFTFLYPWNPCMQEAECGFEYQNGQHRGIYTVDMEGFVKYLFFYFTILESLF
jgi:hypothetical protein